MFCFTIKTILDKLEKHAPIIYASLLEIKKSLGTENEKAAIFKGFTDVKDQKANISIDFAVMEKEAENILLVKAEKELEWDDIGLWMALKKYFPKDENDNIVRGNVAFNECKNNLVLNYEKNVKVALKKIEDLLVVNTENGILVCPQSSSIRASEIVPKLEINKKEILIDCQNIKIKNATELPVAFIACHNLIIEVTKDSISLSQLS